ncbi:MAG TPA: tetratricopeptide repeat protein [Polyangiaceae bacterium]|jgi:tetratricopeptide (TPR) repeat protein
MRSIRHWLLVLAFGATLFAVPGRADEANDYPAACDASKVTPTDRDRAHTVFISGKGFLEESNYDKAIGYFKDAYSIDCSVHGILPIIATAYERKGDKAEAVRALDEYLKRAPNAADHEVIERRIRNLKDQLSHEQPAPTVAPPAPAPSVAPAPPPAASETIAPAPPPPPPPAAPPAPPSEGGHTAGPWIVTGVGGVAALAGVILFSVGTGDVSSADNQCPDRGHCASQSAVDSGNRGIQLKNAGGGLIAGGLVVAAAGLIWHFLEKPSEHSAAASAPTLEPVAAPGYAGVTMHGAF